MKADAAVPRRESRTVMSGFTLPTHDMIHSAVREAPAEQKTLLLRLIDLAQTLSDMLALFSAQHGLSERDCHALAVLSSHDAITAKSLGQLCHMHKTGISRVIRSLAERKLITCERNHLDLRKVTLVMTPSGAALGREIVMAAAQLTDRLERGMPRTERDNLHNALLSITARMKQIARVDSAPVRQRHVSSAAL